MNSWADRFGMMGATHMIKSSWGGFSKTAAEIPLTDPESEARRLCETSSAGQRMVTAYPAVHLTGLEPGILREDSGFQQVREVQLAGPRQVR